MIVTATYSNNSTKEVTGYTITDGDNLTIGKTSVTISYTENDITKTTTQKINVTKDIEITFENCDEFEENQQKYIENITPNTKIDKITEKINTNGQIKIYQGTQEITDKNTKMATGMTLKITLGNTNIEYKLSIKGKS